MHSLVTGARDELMLSYLAEQRKKKRGDRNELADVARTARALLMRQ